MEIVKDDEWGLYPNFTKEEMQCTHTNFCEVTHKLMQTLQDMRYEYGAPIIISSGYRDVSHPAEKDKNNPGEHALGMAADILVHSANAILLCRIAMDKGVSRVGVQQKGWHSGRFIHIGVGDTSSNDRFKPTIWSY